MMACCASLLWSSLALSSAFSKLFTAASKSLSFTGEQRGGTARVGGDLLCGVTRLPCRRQAPSGAPGPGPGRPCVSWSQPQVLRAGAGALRPSEGWVRAGGLGPRHVSPGPRSSHSRPIIRLFQRGNPCFKNVRSGSLRSLGDHGKHGRGGRTPGPAAGTRALGGRRAQGARCTPSGGGSSELSAPPGGAGAGTGVTGCPLKELTFGKEREKSSPAKVWGPHILLSFFTYRGFLGQPNSVCPGPPPAETCAGTHGARGPGVCRSNCSRLFHWKGSSI